MKKILFPLAIACMAASFVACDDDGVAPDEVLDNTVVSGLIEEDQTWTADQIYELSGRVIVVDGVTLTIEPGTIIKGQDGQGVNASALMIARGGKLHAVGTAEKPIIFTTILDNIQVGEVSGSNLRESDKGKWGGLVVLGSAPISYGGGSEAQIEGVPSGESFGLYGGNLANDNSGKIQFVSIRHGGTEISGGNEINGLTLGGVGSGTTISDVEIFANNDDGIEFFGGSVNVSNILVSHQGDDGVDIDQAYSGMVDGFMVVHAGATDKGLEIDGPEGAENANGKFNLKNGTVVGSGNAGHPADFKSKAQGTIENVIFRGYDTGQKILIAGSYDDACAPSSNAFKNMVNGDLVFSDVSYAGYTVDVYASSGECDTSNDDVMAADLIGSGDAATGGPAVSTWSWSMTASLSLID